ncbi:hypothetical protein JHK86_013039 [Glycine max]|nr:hypothetical protein JHK86_013039 [Glycine max]
MDVLLYAYMATVAEKLVETLFLTSSSENRKEITIYLGKLRGLELVQGFDQETAAVVMARLASLKMETEGTFRLIHPLFDQEAFDATRWLDRLLIHLCSKFGDYRKDDQSSFTLTPSFSLFPQFMFNMGRSQFVQVFNNSPDETAYFRMLLNRENISKAAVMIQPFSNSIFIRCTAFTSAIRCGLNFCGLDFVA